ncbi:DoxX family protein [Thermomonospora cellulosilytica]|uniref:Putative membrane protein YphA (DoxX/SURF4 family) n=1 Tax=Thermomonospora cellulosilytica TaxID=1411118 RepID=A0A7W3N336_9ACTN|nr:DoxX family protein [Thermomonospora cellulosilytica]MBA9006588.1 putative membrane protein YphA (DoxX/SURF4 family) [Thermomonospora cellulosilytica]
MDVIALIGRIVFTAIFIGSAVGHLTATDAMAGYAQAKKLPQPRLAVRASGIYILVASAMLILGIWPDLAALALVPFLLMTAFIFHDFWTVRDPGTRRQEQLQFLKDVSLVGGALAIFAMYAGDPHPGLNLVGPLF